jgi:ABC-type nitrate/sulfonate/bicarbonate transport system permease component
MERRRGCAVKGRNVISRPIVSRLLVPLGSLITWQLLATAAADVYFLPPLQIAAAAGQLDATRLLVHDILPSLMRVLSSWTLAAAVGAVAGVALGRCQAAADCFELALGFLRTVPPPLLVPVFMVACGLGTTMELTTIVFGAVWPVLINTMDGARCVEPILADTARVFRISRWRWITGVVLPAAGPKVFAGLRVSLSIALILMVISELVGSTSGIGYQLSLAQGSSDLPAMWVWIVVIGLLGYLLNRVLLVAEDRMLLWHRRSK